MLEQITHQRITILVLFFLVLSMLYQIIIGLLYQNMIKQADNMSATKHKLLNQCKLQYSTTYQLHEGNVNTQIFVERFFIKMRLGKVRLSSLCHISGQLMMLSILFAGMGVCKGIVEGLTIVEIVPYYFMSFIGLYLYFSVASLVDLAGKKEMVKITLVDFFENRMNNRLNYNINDIIAQKEWTPIQKQREKEPEPLAERKEEITSRGHVEKTNYEASTKEEELATLLSEFFA